ncbi:MAG: FAD/NAD(P)-binding protein, partial [Woeseiaceae bacterium]
MQQQYHVAIIGGGFSGTALAINLIRLAERPMQITLVEERDRLGRGLAYSTTVESHVLNTRVGNMSLFSDAPGLFKHWLEASGTKASESEFAPRASYGDYIEDTLIESIAMHQEDSAEFTACLQTRATAVTRRSGRFDVSLDDRRTLCSDAVVVATGNPAPADPLAPWLGPLTSRYLRDAWDQDRIAMIAPTDRVLILGTGLTTVDVALALRRNGHTGDVHAMSRRGLLPRVHGSALQELPDSLRVSLQAAAGSRNLRTLLGAMREAIRLAEERGISWHSVIDALRPITSALWAELPDRERRRFTRHLQSYW